MRRSWRRSGPSTAPPTRSSARRRPAPSAGAASGPRRSGCSRRAGGTPCSYSALRSAPTSGLQMDKMTYIGDGMKAITQEHQRAARTADNSSAAAAKLPEGLTPREERLLTSVLADNPQLTPEKALAMLREAGA